MKICKVDGCNKKHDSHGYCGMHNMRLKRYGDINYITTKEKRSELCRDAQLKRFKDNDIKKTTYRKYFNKHIHRIIAEEIIGRKLNKNEIVHHIDGNKHNNNPNNLEIISQSDHIKKHLKKMLETRKEKHGY